MKSFLEWYLGVPPAGPGQGTAWNLHARPPWPADWPQWSILLLAAAALLVVVWLYVRDARHISRTMQLVLILLRLGTIGVLLIFLSETVLSVDRTGLPVVAVLLDDSASMGLEDRYADKRTRAAAQSLIDESPYAEATRLNLLKALLSRSDGQFLKRLQHNHKLRAYRFSDSAVPLGSGEYLVADDVDELLPALLGLAAEGNQTRPGHAVRQVLDELRGSPPSAIVLLSDGITSTSDADSLAAVEDYARGKLVPIYIVGIGSEEATRDVQLYDLLVDDVAFVDDPITFSAQLKAYGYAEQMLQVHVREQSSNAVLASGEVRALPDGESAEFELTYTPPLEGEFDYVVEVSPQAEETNTQNNRESRHVSVRKERIRVLLIDSQPRYEFRYLKHMLERDRTIELNTVLQDADVEYSAEDQTALDRVPVRREDLFRYDVIIFGDVDPSFLSPDVLENLDDFVRETGGGIIVVAGSSHTPAAYQGTPLDVMLPVKLTGSSAAPEAAASTETFRPELTVEGREQSAIFRLAETEDESLEVWNQLPELAWLYPAPELKPGAMLLAIHPTRVGLDGPLPVIALQRYGAGKVLFHATDELWRWRFRVGDLYYARYWVQAIRYLSRSRLLGSDRAAELTSDRAIYRRGETVQLRVRFLDEKLVPTGAGTVSVMLEHRGQTRRPVTLSRSLPEPSVFEAQLPGLADGSYHAWVVSPAFDSVPPAIDFRIEEPLRELQKRSLDRAELVQVAKGTHGKFYSLAEAERLPLELPPGQPVTLDTQDPIPLWSRWELLVLFGTLLGAEWLLRKRCRLI